MDFKLDLIAMNRGGTRFSFSLYLESGMHLSYTALVAAYAVEPPLGKGLPVAPNVLMPLPPLAFAPEHMHLRVVALDALTMRAQLEFPDGMTVTYHLRVEKRNAIDLTQLRQPTRGSVGSSTSTHQGAEV